MCSVKLVFGNSVFKLFLVSRDLPVSIETQKKFKEQIENKWFPLRNHKFVHSEFVVVVLT